MKIKEKMKNVPCWMLSILAIIVAFGIVFGVQRIFVRLVPNVIWAGDYWNLRWMRLENIMFFGYDLGDWFWIDTFIFFVGTFVSTLFASFIIHIAVKKFWRAFFTSLGVGIVGIIPTVMIFLDTKGAPRHVLYCFTVYRYELVKWTIISAISGIIFFFSINKLYIFIKKRKEKYRQLKEEMEESHEFKESIE